ncbi:zinc-ribbon domain-containing protein [Clostridium fessum]
MPLKPDEVNAKSRKNVWWRCSKCGNEWKSVINARVKGTVLRYGKIPYRR